MSNRDPALRSPEPTVVVSADIEENAAQLIESVLTPAGIRAWPDTADAPSPDVLVVDISQMRGDPLAMLRARRSRGDETPAIVLAAHIPTARIRDLFRLGVGDLLLKPFRPEDLRKAIYELTEARSAVVTSQLLARRLQASRDELRRRTEEIRMLSEIGRVVVSLKDLDEILTRVVEAAAFVTGAEEANLYLAESGTNEIVLRASKQAGSTKGTLQRLRINDTLAGTVYRTGQPVLRQPMLEGGPVKVQTGFLVQSLIKAPIRARNEVVGVLGVYNRFAQRPFTEHHLTVLMALADWAGVALEQAQLLEQARTAFPEPAAPAGTRRESPAIESVPPDLVRGLDRMIGSLERLLQRHEGDFDPETRGELQQLRDGLIGLGNLPIAVLDPGRSRELVDLPGLVLQIVEEIRPAAARHGLELITEPGVPVPLFSGDHSRTRRVIEALVIAAIRRTNRGRIVLGVHRFEVREGRSDDLPLPDMPQLGDGMWVAVRVADTSAGLSPDTVRALTADQVDPDSGQVGAGLTVGEIRMIAESLSGTLWYDQTPASTSITFALPIQ